MSETFTRATEREPISKPFNYTADSLAGYSNKELMKKANPNHDTAAQVYENCLLYARSYSETMLHRVLEEEPEFF